MRGRDGGDDIRADEFGFEPIDELAGDGEGHIRLEQGYAHFTQGGVDILLAQAALAAQLIEGFGEAFTKIFEHSLLLSVNLGMAGVIWIKGTMTKTAAAPEKTADISALSFEAAMKELEIIVRGLESGSADLDRAIADYQRGNALKEHCLAKLAEAKLKVEQIQMKSDGSITTKEFATE